MPLLTTVTFFLYFSMHYFQGGGEERQSEPTCCIRANCSCSDKTTLKLSWSLSHCYKKKQINLRVLCDWYFLIYYFFSEQASERVKQSKWKRFAATFSMHFPPACPCSFFASFSFVLRRVAFHLFWHPFLGFLLSFFLSFFLWFPALILRFPALLYSRYFLLFLPSFPLFSRSFPLHCAPFLGFRAPFPLLFIFALSERLTVLRVYQLAGYYKLYPFGPKAETVKSLCWVHCILLLSVLRI